jgi:hypothetical protein
MMEGILGRARQRGIGVSLAGSRGGAVVAWRRGVVAEGGRSVVLLAGYGNGRGEEGGSGSGSVRQPTTDAVRHTNLRG